MLAFVLYGVGNGLLTSFSDKPEPLTTHPENQLAVRVGYVLVVLNSVVVVFIAALLFPILKRYSSPVALSYLIARIGEAVLLWMGAISAGNMWTYQMAMLILGLGSIGFCYVLFSERLVPKPLSVMGLVGYLGLALGSLCELWGLPASLILSIPSGLFELGFGVWMLIRGFSIGPVLKLTGD